MKKNLKYMIFASFLFLFSVVGVKAEENAKCVYTLNSTLNADIVVTITDGKIDVKVTGSGYSLNSGASNLAQVNFQSNEKWKCPSKIYWKVGTTSGSTRLLPIAEITTTNKNGYSSSSLNSGKSSDGGSIGGTNGTSGKTLSCKYGNFTITYSATTFTHNSPCAGGNSVSFDQKNLSLDECPEKVYKVSSNGRGGDFCAYSLTSSGGSSIEIKLNEDEPILDADGNDHSGNTTEQPTTTTDKNPSAGCDILGGANSKTVKLLSGIVKLIRLGVPILIIILGMTDFLTILFSGEDKTYKDAFTKFVKRLLIGIIIIFIPYVLHFLIRISGVDKQYGIDSFFCGIIDQVSGVSGNEVETMTADPSDITSATACQEAGHYWIEASQSCSETLKELSEQEECESNGYEWVYNNQEYGGYCKRPSTSTIHDKESCEKIGYTWVYANEEYGGHCQK